MKTENLRPVINQKAGIKNVNGFFHIWKKNLTDNGSEIVFGLIEDEKSGSLFETPFTDITFKKIKSQKNSEVDAKSDYFKNDLPCNFVENSSSLIDSEEDIFEF